MPDLNLTDDRDTLKMLRETLCVAASALGLGRSGPPPGAAQRLGHIDRIQRVINEIDRQRPLGPDGKHGDRHTATCGCEDRDA